jgi:endonuclease G
MPVRELAVSRKTLGERLRQESIVLRTMRPVLAIKQDVAQLEFTDGVDSETWRERLAKAEAALAPAIRAVGRINLTGSDVAWAGTGWLIAENVLATSRQVALRFARRDGERFTFAIGERGTIRADVDFLQEVDSDATLSFELKEVLHIEDDLDVAFFAVAVEGDDGKLAAPIKLADTVAATRDAAVIGYPVYDSRIPEPDLLKQVFGDVCNKKGLAPGAVTAVKGDRILHNCSTLGGNSGAVVIDLTTGEALGLHFSGAFLTTGHAVRADVVKQRLEDLRRAPRRAVRAEEPAPSIAAPQSALVDAARTSAAPAFAPRPSNAKGASFTVPLTVTVSLGAPQSQATRPETTR